MGQQGVTGEPVAFEFATAGRVIFGAGRASEVGRLANGLGARLLVCTGAHPERYADLLDRITAPTAVFRVTDEPTVEMARAAVTLARDHGADCVVGIGGGSALDMGKAVAMVLGNGGDPLDYLEIIGRGQPITRPSAPYVAVPTTAGTGAEVTANAVLGSPEHGRKASLRSAFMLPRIALVDPLLTVACPPAVTASSGLDALTQCLEPYVSVRATPLTDGLAREGLRRAAAGLRRAYADGSDVKARTDMAVCSLLGGMSLANAKLGAVHGFAGPIGGVVNAPHGAVCAALLAAVVETNVHALRTRASSSASLAKYEDAARLLTGRADASIDDGIAWIRETVELLQVPGLGAYGLKPDHVADVVAKAKRASSMQGNPIELTDDELQAILAASL
jgi:alcohol dehydrogenase class IV